MLIPRILFFGVIGICLPFRLALAGNSFGASELQLVVVTGDRWNSSGGTLRLYERKSVSDKWLLSAEPVPAALGIHGFAWGRGVDLPGKFTEAKFTERQLDEGDMSSPAGIFPIESIFGFDPADKAAGIKMPYRRILPSDECVDDPASRYYNQIVTPDQTKDRDWNSSEKMHAPGSGYQIGIIFGQNPPPAVPRQGSCIFLHPGPTRGGTFGCTTASEAVIRRLAHWLDPVKHPALVQLPEPVYRQIQAEWDLPPL